MVSKTKKYPCVYIDKKDRIYISIELGKDPISGKRVQHKARRTKEGKPFESQKEAYDEVVRIKYENGRKLTLEHYNISFADYMKDIYLPAYKQKVDFSTYKTAMAHHNLFVTSFGKKQLKAITPQECELFRIRLINDYSKNYAKNLWSRFKACLGYAERLGYISNIHV